MKSKHLSLGTLLASVTIALATTTAYGESKLSSEKTFFCQNHNNTFTTLAKTEDGEIIPIFHWREQALPSETNLEQTCNEVSRKLENYLISHGDLTKINFKPARLENIPAVCLAGENNDCNLILMSLSPVEKPLETANEVLKSTLDPQLQTNKQVSHERGVQSIYYSVNLWQLLGLEF